MKSLHYTYTLLRSGIVLSLLTVLGSSCAHDTTDRPHHPTSKYDTAETRAARMRRALRETSEGQAIHRAYIQCALKALQNDALDNHGLGEIATKEQRAAIESGVLEFEEKEIKRFAGYNSRLETNPFYARALNPIVQKRAYLVAQEALFEKGEMDEEQIQIARIALQLAKKKHSLNDRFTNLLISANNFG
jgi:hypothetical protein